MDKLCYNCWEEKGFGNGRIILWIVLVVYKDLVKDLYPSLILPSWILVIEKNTRHTRSPFQGKHHHVKASSWRYTCTPKMYSVWTTITQENILWSKMNYSVMEKSMGDEFLPSWISYLEKIMSKWVNKWTRPGFMVVPSKPWTCVNEYYTICCCQSVILFAVELVEGTYKNFQDTTKSHIELRKMVGIVLRLSKYFRNTDILVVMYSGLCVLKAIIEFNKVGIFNSSLINERR